MVVLIFGNDSLSRELNHCLACDGHRTLMTDDSGQIPALLEKENGLDMLIIGQSYQNRSDSPENIAASDNLKITDGLDYPVMEKVYDANVVQPLQAIQRAVPYMEKSSVKRICYINITGGSNNCCYDDSHYAAHMAAAAVNMQINLLFNRLRQKGYTFRLYGMDNAHRPQIQAKAAQWYFMSSRSVDSESEKHTDENRLVMRDFNGREIPW